MKTKSNMNPYEIQLKKKIIMARFSGLLTSAIGIMAIFFYFFHVVHPWFCIILLAYCMAMSFMMNSIYQEIKIGRFYCILNLVFAVIFMVAMVGIIIFSFVTGQIRL